MFRRVSFLMVVAAAVAVTVVGAQSPTPTPITPKTRVAGPVQTPAPVAASATVTLTAVIQAIDSKDRAVTLKHKDGTLDTIYCGPEVKRFDELKVGDSVTFTYHEAVVMSIAAAGATAKEPATAVVRGAGEKPAGIVAQRMSAIVTVLAIDPKVPSVTIQKQDGSKASFKVENPKNIEGVKVGDKVQITYTQAVAVSVK
jgi:Cu/Ag efflux protein CusF